MLYFVVRMDDFIYYFFIWLVLKCNDIMIDYMIIKDWIISDYMCYFVDVNRFFLFRVIIIIELLGC